MSVLHPLGNRDEEYFYESYPVLQVDVTVLGMIEYEIERCPRDETAVIELNGMTNTLKGFLLDADGEYRSGFYTIRYGPWERKQEYIADMDIPAVWVRAMDYANIKLYVGAASRWVRDFNVDVPGYDHPMRRIVKHIAMQQSHLYFYNINLPATRHKTSVSPLVKEYMTLGNLELADLEVARWQRGQLAHTAGYSNEFEPCTHETLFWLYDAGLMRLKPMIEAVRKDWWVNNIFQFVFTPDLLDRFFEYHGSSIFPHEKRIFKAKLQELIQSKWPSTCTYPPRYNKDLYVGCFRDAAKLQKILSEARAVYSPHKKVRIVTVAPDAPSKSSASSSSANLDWVVGSFKDRKRKPTDHEKAMALAILPKERILRSNKDKPDVKKWRKSVDKMSAFSSHWG